MDKGECRKVIIEFAKLHCIEQARVINKLDFEDLP
jgi:hypothetical protein